MICFRPEEDEDDEIFFGPIGHTERCVATNAATKATKLIDEMQTTKTLSPLNAEQVVEIFKEATSIAVMLKSSSDVPSDSDLDEQNRRKNFPELITDIEKSANTGHQDENAEILPKIKTTNNKTDDCDDNNGFVVRRRVLREGNPLNVKNEVNSPKSQQLQTPIRSTNRKSVSYLSIMVTISYHTLSYP